MKECIALVKVKINYDVSEKTPEEVLAFIKSHMGYYSDHDTAKLIEVISVAQGEP